jgi:ParB-like chromosome segregation protein Spo0J
LVARETLNLLAQVQTLVSEQEGKVFEIIDGYHRFAAANLNKKKEIKIIIITRLR